MHNDECLSESILVHLVIQLFISIQFQKVEHVIQLVQNKRTTNVFVAMVTLASNVKIVIQITSGMKTTCAKVFISKLCSSPTNYQTCSSICI